MPLLEQLQRFDQDLFTWIHYVAIHPFLDPVMLQLREPLTWVPLYAFVLYWVIRYRRENAIIFVVLSLATFALADFGSASILKPFFQRDRPCHNAELAPIIRNLLDCGGRYGMPSTHSSNHFALATFWFLSTKLMRGRRWGWLWIWAVLVVYAQVYVGKHYPFDILVGAVFGILVGWLMYLFFRKFVSKSENKFKK
ncbi:MAG TPA: phosphatase PAP2 family protein [Parasegetibacter sp.]|jgi:membrane-associated phospholipid phosphatase